jgi:hypothetical protein
MSVRVSSVFVLPCVGSGLATGLITHLRNLLFQIYSDGKQARGPNMKGIRRRRRRRRRNEQWKEAVHE